MVAVRRFIFRQRWDRVIITHLVSIASSNGAEAAGIDIVLTCQFASVEHVNCDRTPNLKWNRHIETVRGMFGHLSTCAHHKHILSNGIQQCFRTFSYACLRNDTNRKVAAAVFLSPNSILYQQHFVLVSPVVAKIDAIWLAGWLAGSKQAIVFASDVWQYWLWSWSDAEN